MPGAVRSSDVSPKASENLRSIVRIIETTKGAPTQVMLQNLRSLAVDALAALSNPDPRIQTLVMVALAIKHTTSIETKMVFGKPRQITRILDRGGLDWAIEQVHRLAAS